MPDVGADNLVVVATILGSDCGVSVDLEWDAGSGSLYSSIGNEAYWLQRKLYSAAPPANDWDDTLVISASTPPTGGSYDLFVDGDIIHIVWNDSEATIQGKFTAKGQAATITGNGQAFTAAYADPDAPAAKIDPDNTTGGSGMLLTSDVDYSTSPPFGTTATSETKPAPLPAFFYEDDPSFSYFNYRIRTLFGSPPSALPAQNSNTVSLSPYLGATGTYGIDLTGFPDTVIAGDVLIIGISTIAFPPPYSGPTTEPITVDSPDLTWTRVASTDLDPMFTDQKTRFSVFVSSRVPDGWDASQQAEVSYASADGGYHDAGIVVLAKVHGRYDSLTVATGKSATATTSDTPVVTQVTLSVAYLWAATMGGVDPSSGFIDITAPSFFAFDGPVSAYKQGFGNPLWPVDPGQWGEDPSWCIVNLRFR